MIYFFVRNLKFNRNIRVRVSLRSIFISKRIQREQIVLKVKTIDNDQELIQDVEVFFHPGLTCCYSHIKLSQKRLLNRIGLRRATEEAYV